MNNLIDAINDWFLQQCNGDWEHENQIKIETVDNPGWFVTIDLQGTKMEYMEYEKEVNTNDNDWYFISVKDKQFKASSDIRKLNLILSEFINLTMT